MWRCMYLMNKNSAHHSPGLPGLDEQAKLKTLERNKVLLQKKSFRDAMWALTAGAGVAITSVAIEHLPKLSASLSTGNEIQEVDPNQVASHVEEPRRFP